MTTTTELDWDAEEQPSDDFPDLVCYTAYTRGAFPGPWFAGNELPEGARCYFINDWTDPGDGTHCSNLQMWSVEQRGWINDDGDWCDDVDDACAPNLETNDKARSALIEGPDSLARAKAQAAEWEAS